MPRRNGCSGGMLVSPGAEMLVDHAVARAQKAPGRRQIAGIDQVGRGDGGMPGRPERVRPLLQAAERVIPAMEQVHGELAPDLVVVAERRHCRPAPVVGPGKSSSSRVALP